MDEFFLKLFDTADFPPRWNCGHWSQGHGWLHIASDTAIGAAYAAIPLLLIYFMSRRRDLPLQPIFILFACFIFSCGLGHLIEATLFWHPWYRFSGLIKLVTAIVSWATVLALIPIVPRVLEFPRLASVNEALEKQLKVQQETENRLQVANDELRFFVKNVLDRENRILELKAEVNVLLSQLGLKSRYAAQDQQN